MEPDQDYEDIHPDDRECLTNEEQGIFKIFITQLGGDHPCEICGWQKQLTEECPKCSGEIDRELGNLLNLHNSHNKQEN